MQAGLAAAIAARQGHDAHHPRVRHEAVVVPGAGRQRQLERHLDAGRQGVQAPGDPVDEQLVSLRARGAADVDLELQDGQQPGVEDLPCHHELLVDHPVDRKSYMQSSAVGDSDNAAQER